MGRIYNKNEIDEIYEYSKNYAIKRDGLLVSTRDNFSVGNIVLFCIKHNHQWISKNSSIKKGRWCFYCSRENVNLQNTKTSEQGLQNAIKRAAERFGECLSTEYTGYKQKMLWKCEKEEHPPFYSSYTNVVTSTRWCPNCALERKARNNTTENRVRIILETYFGFPLKTRRPDWNRYPWNNYAYPLELDGYNEQFKLAFEYDGYQHSKNANVHYVSKEKQVKFIALQKLRDYAKEQNCIREGITLIRIPAPKQHISKSFKLLLNYLTEICVNYDILLKFTDEQIKEMEIKFIEEGSNGQTTKN